MAKDAAVREFSWRRLLLKELLIFGAILIVLAMLWHPDLLHSPVTRADRLSKSAMVSFWHPLMWSGGIYLFTGIFRLFLALIRRLQH